MTLDEFTKSFNYAILGIPRNRLTEQHSLVFYQELKRFRIDDFDQASKYVVKNFKQFPVVAEWLQIVSEIEQKNEEERRRRFAGRYPQAICEFCDGSKFASFDGDFKPEKYPNGFCTRCNCAGGQLTEEEKAYIRYRKTAVSCKTAVEIEAEIQKIIAETDNPVMKPTFERMLALCRSSNTSEIQPLAEVPY